MSHQRYFASFLALTALAGFSGAQTGAGGLSLPKSPGTTFDPGPRSFSVRVEPRADFLRTRGTTFVNVPGAAGSFVAYEDFTQVSVSFSAEVYSTAQSGRVFVRALLDGVPMSPGDVVFAQTDFDGVQSFTFAGIVHTGVHSVEMQWKVDAIADAYVRGASLLVKTGERAGEQGSLSYVVPPSGPAQQTSNPAWSDVPGAALDFYVPKNAQALLSFSAEAFVAFATGGSGERMFVRVLVDGAAAAPENVAFTESIHPEARQMNFGTGTLAPGWHMARVQWASANGGFVYLGDRSLVASCVPPTSIAGHYFRAPVSGPTLVKSDDQWEAVPGLKLDCKVPENGEVALSVGAEVKTDAGAVLELRLLDQGAIVSDTTVALASDDGLYEARTFTFDAKHMFAPGGAGGVQTFIVQWRALQGKAYMGDRTLSLCVEPGDYPDLAEPSPFGWLPLEPAIGARNVLTILLDAGCDPPNDVTAPVAEFAEALYGNRSARDYFEVVSGERFSIANAGIIGWVQALKDCEHYTDHDGCPNADGFTGGHQERWFEAITAADAQFDFSAYDTNHDGVLHPQELMVLIASPGDVPGGDMRNFTPFCDGTTPLFDGVVIPAIGEWFTNEPLEEWEVAAHEIAHLSLGFNDMYVQPENSWTEPYKLSLMANNVGTSTYLDPALRLALGWAMPIEVEQDGVLNLEDVRDSDRVYVLPRRKGGDGREYVLLENRQHSEFDWKYDENIGDAGIAVWHIVESPDQYVYAPACFDQSTWEIITEGPARRGVRLICPLFESDQATRTLWESSLYDLLNHDPVCPDGPNYAQRRNVLRWADGTDAEWQLLNFSAPGPWMSVLVDKLF